MQTAAAGRVHSLLGAAGRCHRPAAALPLKAENGEAIQILKYVDGQKYEPHTDYFHDK